MKKVFILFVWCCFYFPTSIFTQTDQLMTKPYTFTNGKGEKVEAELGSFWVPENRLDPNSRSIQLQFVRFPSTNPKPGYPIVYLAGGPGGSGIGTAKGSRFELFMALRSVADVIAFDQRGTGLSTDIPACPTTAEIDPLKPGSPEYYLPILQKAASECLDFWKEKGIDPAGYTTLESAHDLEDLRKVLEVDKLNLWGISYGTHLAFAMINTYENSIHKCILASLEGPDETIKRPAFNQDFLVHLNTQLKKQGPENPDIINLMKELFERLEKTPVVVDYTDLYTKEKKKVSISKFDLQLYISFFLLKNPEDSKKLPAILSELAMGDYSSSAPYIGLIKAFMGRVDLMSLVMDAASGISPRRWEKIQKEAETALLGRTTNFPFPDITQGLELPDLGTAFRKNPKTDIPTLLLSGDLDGRTYLPAAMKLAKGFKNGRHIVIEGAGHDLFMSTPDVQRAMLDFMNDRPVNIEKIEVSNHK